jgi:hypothetical protein
MAGKLVLTWIGVCIVGAGCVTQARAAGTQRQETYSSKSNGFSVTAPAGWHRIPDSAIQQYRKAAFTAETAGKMHFETAFQARTQPWFVHPYFVVQVVHYDHHAQPSERQMRHIVEEMTGISEKEWKSAAKREVAESIGNMKMIKVGFIPDEKKLIWEFRADVANVGRVRASAVGHFGRKSLVMVNCYCLERNLARLEPAFRQVHDSFEFHPGSEYQKVEFYRKPAAIILMVAVGIGILSYVFRRRG